MTSHFAKARRRTLICGAAIAAVLAATPALAQEQLANIDIPAQPMAQALNELAKQSGANLLFTMDMVKGLQSKPLQTSATPETAARMLLAGTDLTVMKDATGSLIVRTAADPQSGSAAGDGADAGTVAALIVTAQKKEENIQDVPIAISAFTEKSLEEQKIEGGFDLLKAIPNVTFSKNNFTSYNFSIRGIGTKAVSATTDPGVAVSFNNIPLLQNRLFEQEYFDVERVEVLRGPQGTLYGRNATAGVVNVISAKPNLQDFSGWLKGEVGNYDTKRISAMVNVPLLTDKLGIRFAGALTDRSGYDYNAVTKHAVNGRDLWSGRITIGFNPTERVRTNLVWERFNEDDNRSRTGKQLCHRDDGPETIAGVSVEGTNRFDGLVSPKVRRALFSQGCKPGSLYEDAAFGTPNGLSYNFILGEVALRNGGTGIGYKDGGAEVIVQERDPYGGLMQSKDLRQISSFRAPIYRAKADVWEFNADVDLAPGLTLSSQTAFDRDQTYSFQDYNRFNTEPIFTDTSSLTQYPYSGSSPYVNLARGGIFCDPQLGCSDTIAGFDIAKAKGEQFSQEVRIQSSFDGPVNFSLGANYTKFHTLVDYYVMFNLMTAMAEAPPFNINDAYALNPGPVDPAICTFSNFLGLYGIFWGQYSPNPVPTSDPRSICPYIDPNPVESMNGEGHNYFRSKNPYKLKSAGVFGELYWDVSEKVKVTAGLRYSDDHKTFIPVPSQALLAPGLMGGGVVPKGYPEEPAIKQHWGEWTGRLGVDWKPDLPFPGQALLYAFYSRGYKAGGANPPSPGFATLQDLIDSHQIDAQFLSDSTLRRLVPVLELTGVEYSRTFRPEFVNAFEVGSKSTILGGALTLNADAFFYDYKDYQVSQIRDRTAVNENFDAQAWGAEFQTVFSPTRNFQLIGNVGYLDTAIADGEKSIDIMNRTQGDPNYVLVKPWAQLPSNCVAPTPVVKWWLENMGGVYSYFNFCGGARGLLGILGLPFPDPTLGGLYDPRNYPEINGGAGILADLGGKELPNAPHWTVNLGGQYGFNFLEGWRATVRGDAYWQSQSWARVYNSNPYDKLHGWYNVNLSVWVERPEDGLKIELYAKNILDKSPITDSFLNSDDTGLTTNVFTLDPRLIGLSIKKGF